MPRKPQVSTTSFLKLMAVTSQGQSITKLTSDLGTTNAALAKKAEATAVTALTQQVEQNGRDIRSNTDSITSLSNQLVNGQPNRWSRRLYPVQLANAGTVPSFSDVRAVAPTVVDEVTQTDANVASKADQTAMNSLTGRVEKTESGLAYRQGWLFAVQ